MGATVWVHMGGSEFFLALLDSFETKGAAQQHRMFSNGICEAIMSLEEAIPEVMLLG